MYKIWAFISIAVTVLTVTFFYREQIILLVIAGGFSAIFWMLMDISDKIGE